MMEQEELYIELIENLQSLSIGSRAWYWYSPDTDRSYPQLMLHPLENGMPNMSEKSDAIPVSQKGKVYLGLCSVNEEGQYSFAGRSNDQRMHNALAKWVRDRVKEYPALAHLSGAKINCEESGQITKSYYSPAIWGINRLYSPGTMANTMSKLAQMTAKSEAFVWLCERGPGGRPYLYLQDRASDPDGDSFSEFLVRLRRQISSPGRTIRGAFRFTSSGRLILATEDPINDAAQIINQILQATDSNNLQTALLIQLKNGQAIGTKAQESYRDIGSIIEILKKLEIKQSAYFAVAAKELYISTERKGLESLLQKVSADEKIIKGKVIKTKKRYEFRTKKVYEKLLRSIIRWTSKTVTDWPELSILSGARVVTKDSESNIIDTQKDDDRWEKSLKKGE